MRGLALDLSTAKTGWVVGEAGRNPDEWGTIIRPKALTTHPDIFAFFVREIRELVEARKLGLVVCEEVNSSQNMATTRILCGLYGAVSFGIKESHGIDLFALNTTTCRKRAGVDLSRKVIENVKDRVRRRLIQLGFDNKDNDINDAAVVLRAAPELLEI